VVVLGDRPTSGADLARGVALVVGWPKSSGDKLITDV